MNPPVRDYSLFLLFYNCLHSSFAFNSYYNYTCRSSDRSIVGSNNRISNHLAQDVGNNNLLTLSTSNLNLTFASDYFDFGYFDRIIGCRNFVAEGEDHSLLRIGSET